MPTELFTTKLTFRGLSDEDEDEETVADREDLESEDEEDGESEEKLDDADVAPASGDADTE